MPRKSDFHAFIDEDVGRGDITSETVVPRDAKAVGLLVAKEDCVVAGLEEAGTVFKELGLTFTARATDGTAVQNGDTVAEVQGKARSILKGERVALNIVQRMSGIATLTRRMVEAGRRANPRVVVAATRKTTPGFRAFEKRAVQLGGGDPHRFALDDMVLIKDNHLAIAGGVRPAMERLRAQAGPSFAKKIEVEAANLADALLAADLGADIVMLDNFAPSALEAAYKALKSRHPRVLVEVSGNVNESNIAAVAPHADIVSSGALTHSARACDFSLEMTPIK
jgi:nicotinate-nucleotide pyrophosphorylase (carboxylating)